MPLAHSPSSVMVLTTSMRSRFQEQSMQTVNGTSPRPTTRSPMCGSTRAGSTATARLLVSGAQRTDRRLAEASLSTSRPSSTL
ncbi:hypothetical protein BJ165DRAFT_1516828 [Panaeolus papilionaceus]|nr:hypothetical protein BJ165DRAFT_1516828 [Panaeolus papilionaceus]